MNEHTNLSTLDSESNIYYLYYSDNAKRSKKPPTLKTYTATDGQLAVGQFICKDKHGEAFEWLDKQLVAVVNDLQRTVERFVNENESQRLADDRLMMLLLEVERAFEECKFKVVRDRIRQCIDKGTVSLIARIAAQLALNDSPRAAATVTTFCELVDEVEQERK